LEEADGLCCKVLKAKYRSRDGQVEGGVIKLLVDGKILLVLETMFMWVVGVGLGIILGES
jgi:hypothetical protein